MKYFFCYVFFILISCTENQDNFIKKLKTSHLVIHDTLNIKCDDLGNPCFILPYKNLVFLADNSGRHLLTQYDLNRGSVTNILEKGKAENEALIITSMEKIGENELYIYDDFSKKKIYFRIDSNQCYLNDISNVDNFYSSIETENFVICVSDSLNNRFNVKDKRDGNYHSFGDYSLYGNDFKSAIGISDGLLVVNQQQNRFAWFSRFGTSLCISSFSSISGQIVCQKIYQRPDFKLIENKDKYAPIFSGKTIIGFTSITTLRNYIFAMYNGKSFSEVLKNPRIDHLLCDNMCVFDWNGKLLGNIKLNINVKDIYYDIETDKMNFIGINGRGECQIFAINSEYIYGAIEKLY